MKTTFILFFTLIFCIGNKSKVAAQSYIPMPDSNAYWLITDAMIWELFFTDSVKNDTIINLKDYNKLFYAFSMSSPVYAGGYRNDTATQKTFYVPPDSLQEYLLYDFSANVGDTISIIHRIPWPSLPFAFQVVDLVVDSMKYKTIGPRNHKRMYLHDPTWSFVPISAWTEGIGSTDLGGPRGTGILPYLGNDYRSYCMSYNDTVYYLYDLSIITEYNYFPGQCDTMSFPLNTEQIHLTPLEIQIYPSIVSSVFTINATVQNSFPLTLNIYNSLGIISKSYIIKENSTLNIEHFPQGIYFLQIKSKNKILKSQKIIKQ